MRNCGVLPLLASLKWRICFPFGLVIYSLAVTPSAVYGGSSEGDDYEQYNTWVPTTPLSAIELIPQIIKEVNLSQW